MKAINLVWAVGVLSVALVIAVGIKTQNHELPTEPIVQIQPPVEFIPEPPKISIKTNAEDFDFSGNTGISDRYLPLSNVTVSQQDQ
jgi:hypothetical protein